MSNRSKRIKFYHVPNNSSKIQHTTFTVNSGKIFTHNRFVDVAIPDVPNVPSVDPADFLNHVEDEFQSDSINDPDPHLPEKSRQPYTVCLLF
jgi:hypothetical protein